MAISEIGFLSNCRSTFQRCRNHRREAVCFFVMLRDCCISIRKAAMISIDSARPFEVMTLTDICVDPILTGDVRPEICE